MCINKWIDTPFIAKFEWNKHHFLVCFILHGSRTCTTSFIHISYSQLGWKMIIHALWLWWVVFWTIPDCFGWNISLDCEQNVYVPTSQKCTHSSSLPPKRAQFISLPHVFLFWDMRSYFLPFWERSSPWGLIFLLDLLVYLMSFTPAVRSLAQCTALTGAGDRRHWLLFCCFLFWTCDHHQLYPIIEL